MEFINRYEKQLGKALKYVRSDNGGEFVNKNFDDFFKSKGIVHQRTVAYNPQSNGVAERMNRSLLDKTRTMLIDADLPEQFWAEAIVTATFLKNLIPTKANGERTPIEIWEGRKPTVSFLKVFGCVAYYYIPKQIRSKFQPKAEKGIFIGYSKESRGYRVYNIENSRIYAVRTAKFNELEKGSKLLSEVDEKYKGIDNFVYTTLVPTSIPNERGHEQEEEDCVVTEPVEGTEEIGEPEQTETRRGRKPGRNMEQIKEEHRQRIQENENQLTEIGVRRSERIKNRKEQVNNVVHHERKIPANYREAVNSPESDTWIDAMKRELRTMDEHQVWELVPRRRGLKVIKSKWVYTLKEDQDSPKYKARLVAMGCQQRQGMHYTESFAPVIKMQSVRTILAIASVRKLQIRQFDVKAAYLYGTLQEDVYMEQPPGFANGKNEICRLVKSIYGLPQSGYHWNERLNKIMESVGLERLREDPCIYVLHQGRKVVIVGVSL